MIDKTSFIRALRPFSLIVALATCGLGVSLAMLEGAVNLSLVLLVMLTGLLLQVSVNLINDHRDIDEERFSAAQIQAIKRNARVGYVILLIAVLCGLYMVSQRGWPLLILGIVGVLGAWGYTGGQINYKERGLGILLVFFLMGMLLIGGAYYVVSGSYHLNIFWLSLPFSLLSSLLLLSNELRDYEKDLARGIKTLSVRLGYQFGVKLYYGLVAMTYFVTVILYQVGVLNSLLLVIVTLLVLWQPLKLLHVDHRKRFQLAPLTGRFYLVFSIAFIATIWMPAI